MEYINWMLANWNDVVVAVLAVLGAFSAVAKITPTKSDDVWVEKLYNMVHVLGLTKK